MSVTSQASAEASQNQILEDLRASTAGLEDALTTSVYFSVQAIVVDIIAILLILVVISLFTFVYLRIISTRKAAIVLVIILAYLFILSIIFVIYARDYTRKSVHGAAEVFNTYAASENAINDIYQAVLVYGRARSPTMANVVPFSSSR